MGMYDYLQCEAPLPPEIPTWVQTAEFQTKCFDCEMHRYTITREGRLIHHDEYLEPVPEKERTYWGKPEWERPGFRFFGSMRPVPIGDVDMNYHGDVEFYDYTEGGEWWEFVARFNEGQLVRIWRVEGE